MFRLPTTNYSSSEGGDGAADAKLMYQSWAFDGGATIHVELLPALLSPFDGDDVQTPSQLNLNLRLLARSHWDSLAKRDSIQRQMICAEPALYASTVPVASSGPSVKSSFQINITERGEYVCVLAWCSNFPISVRATYTFLNPLNAHDSLEDTPLIAVYAACAGAYGCIAGFYLLWLADKRKRRGWRIRSVEMLIAGAIAFKAVGSVVLVVRYHAFHTREDHDSAMLQDVKVASILIAFLTEVATIIVANLVACGWNIMRDSMLPRDRKFTWLIVAVYSITRGISTIECVGTRLAASPDTSTCSALHLAVLILTYIIVGYVFVAIRSCIEDLQKAMVETDATSAMQHTILFKRFSVGYSVVAVLPAVQILVTYSVLSCRYQYVGVILNESCYLYSQLLIIFCFHTF